MLPYKSFSNHLKRLFGEVVWRISIDAGGTCPNRDGTKGKSGCIFCNNDAFRAGDSSLSIKEQINLGKKRLMPGGKRSFIAYFQSFTNTYGDVSLWQKRYFDAISEDGIVGIAIGTRADCINDEMLDLLSYLNNLTYLLVEIGLQSANDRTLKRINRGHSVRDFIECTEKLKEKRIRVGTHIILGLPDEGMDDFLRTADLIANLKLDAVKIHNLQIFRNTPIEKEYMEGKIKLLSEDEYVNGVIAVLERIPLETVVMRLAGEGKKELALAPEWSFNKALVLKRIRDEMKIRNTWQGKKYLP